MCVYACVCACACACVCACVLGARCFFLNLFLITWGGGHGINEGKGSKLMWMTPKKTKPSYFYSYTNEQYILIV